MKNVAFLSSSNQTFSRSVWWEFKLCHLTVLLIRLPLARIPVLFHRRSDFHMAGNFAKVVYAFPVYMFALLSIDEIFQPKYMNQSANFRVIPFDEEWILSLLKYMNPVLPELKVKLISDVWKQDLKIGAELWQCSRDSAWSGVFERSARSLT